MPRMFRLFIAAALSAGLVTGCATTARTSLEASWRAPKEALQPVRKLLIVTVAADEIAQEDYQLEMAAQLKARGVNAVPSRAYFTRYTDAERARFDRVVKNTDADAILLTRVVSVDSKDKSTSGLIIGSNGAPVATVNQLGGAYAAAFVSSNYVRPNDYTQTTVLAEASLYERPGHTLVWTARVRVDNAADGDLKPAIKQFVGVLLDAADKDGMLPRR